jgi:hypothetical protein
MWNDLAVSLVALGFWTLSVATIAFLVGRKRGMDAVLRQMKREGETVRIIEKK